MGVLSISMRFDILHLVRAHNKLMKQIVGNNGIWSRVRWNDPQIIFLGDCITDKNHWRKSLLGTKTRYAQQIMIILYLIMNLSKGAIVFQVFL